MPEFEYRVSIQADTREQANDLMRYIAHRETTITRYEELPISGNPLSVTCPNCNALPGRPCTMPTTRGRRPVAWVHLSREESAAGI